MSNLIINLYSWLRRHPLMLWSGLMLLTLLLGGMAYTLKYNEDISDFLPLDEQKQDALAVYQEISGANNIIAIFQAADTTKSDADRLVEAVDLFCGKAVEADEGTPLRIMSEFDMEKVDSVMGMLYAHLPYLLPAEKIREIGDSLRDESFMSRRLATSKELLMLPTGGMLAENLGRDPMNQFSPILSELQQKQSALSYELYEGHIFSSDMSRAIAIIESPYGSSETDHNERLVKRLVETRTEIENELGDVKVHITGGPVIAVGNAKQIKQDSMLAVVIAVVLILGLLFYVFRNATNLLLILFSIGWGALFALGLIAMMYSRVSLIVIGMSAVIMGVAVNYPLHFIAHLGHTPSKVRTLKEIVVPLLVGNVTTVGAFLALVPLNSVALRNLGLFCSLLLVGTIFFVLIFLPHLARNNAKSVARQKMLFPGIGNWHPEDKGWLIAVIAIVTIGLGYFSFQTKFDSNISNINYMSGEDKEQMAYFQRELAKSDGETTLYVVCQGETLDEALRKSSATRPVYDSLQRQGLLKGVRSSGDFVPYKAQQAERLAAWQESIGNHKEEIRDKFEKAAEASGFSKDAFEAFYEILEGDYCELPTEAFRPFYDMLFTQNLSDREGGVSEVDILTVENEHLGEVKRAVNEGREVFCFDIKEMNSSISEQLSDDFNYIGWACSLIVFFFLWFSLGSIELALLSFLPMAISWVWILGIMAIFGIQFNIVNIILATFIFGQGDDYTIFMTEGSSYEYAYRRKMLASYRNAIIISAIIMFIGIGALIISKHPALQSLAQVTIVGMFSVVLMAYVFPPFIFRWLVSVGGDYRVRPVSLVPLMRKTVIMGMAYCKLLYLSVVGRMMVGSGGGSPERRKKYRSVVRGNVSRILRHLPGVRYTVRCGKEGAGRGFVAICAEGSLRTLICVASLPVDIVCALDGEIKSGSVKGILRRMGYYIGGENGSGIEEWLRRSVEEGCGVCVSSKLYGELRDSHSIEGMIAAKGISVYPLGIYGVKEVFPADNRSCAFKGCIGAWLGEKLTEAEGVGVGAIEERLAQMTRDMAGEVDMKYLRAFVIDRYRYKGMEVMKDVKAELKGYDEVEKLAAGKTFVEIRESGYGACGLLLALRYPDIMIEMYEEDEDKATLSAISCECCSNVRVLKAVEVIEDSSREYEASESGLGYE